MVRPSKQAVADEVWGLLTGLMAARRDAAFAVAESYGLTMGDMKALLSLPDDQAPTMSGLAEVWACDASNVTWLVDRLEQLGCVQRQASLIDRRAKTVVLTERGRLAREQLRGAFTQAPEQLDRLNVEDLATLAALLHKAGLEECAFSDMVHAMSHKPRPVAAP
jgi:DNA-binding MarR family transcriptional regulator